MGAKTSVYLPDDIAQAWKTSGRSLTDIIRAGLEALGEIPQPVTRDDVRTIIREELATARKAAR